MADLVTLQEYKLYLSQQYKGLDEKNEKDLYYTNLVLPGVSQVIRQLFEQDFESKSRTQSQVVREAKEFIVLDKRPATSLTSVTIDGTLQDVTNFYLEDSAVGLKGDLTLTGLRTTFIVGGKIMWPITFEGVDIVYVGGQALTRGDKWTICKLIAKFDMEDTRAFTSTAEIEAAIQVEFESNRLFNQALAQYRNTSI